MDKRKFIVRRTVFLIILGLLGLTLLAGTFYGWRRYENHKKYSNIRIVEGSLKPGQVLHISLLEKKISPEAATELLGTLQGILDFTSLRTKDKYRIYLTEDNKIHKFIYEKSPIDLYFVVRGEDEKLNAFKPAIYLEKETLTKEFELKSSLFQAMLDAGEKDSLVFDFVDVFAWDIDFFTYPRTGDKIKIYFDKYYKDKKFVKYGRIHAAQYKGRDTFNAIHFAPKNNKVGYYDLKGNPAEKFFLKSPLKFTGRITSLFGPRRDPITFRPGYHNGVDFAAYSGAPIVATSRGRVYFTGWRGGYGKLVKVRHTNGYVTYYGHCSRILVRNGQAVDQGQIVASVGSTGHSTGPHVHYEVRLRGRPLNPLRFSQPKRKPLKGKDLEEFKKYAEKIWENIEELKT